MGCRPPLIFPTSRYPLLPHNFFLFFVSWILNGLLPQISLKSKNPFLSFYFFRSPFLPCFPSFPLGLPHLPHFGACLPYSIATILQGGPNILNKGDQTFPTRGTKCFQQGPNVSNEGDQTWPMRGTKCSQRGPNVANEGNQTWPMRGTKCKQQGGPNFANKGDQM